MKKLLLSTALIALASPAIAHNVWLERSGQANEYVVKFGHEKTETYPEHKLTKTIAVLGDSTQENLKATFKQGEAYVTPSEKTSLVLLAFDNGIWCKKPNGKWVEQTKRNTPDAVSCVAARKGGKAVLKQDDTFQKAHGQAQELVPQGKPEAGKPLAILALIDGKPAAGVPVGLGEDHPSEKTNEKGIAYYTPTAGVNKVWSDFTTSTKGNPDYDEVSVEYMLTFEVK
ncbi:DUF4198 domain-containing protein [Pasteurella sp. PK-2025]|uniref:DUF4198 domain-containing protein n=1 Tax=unclassified Pasteurella TaxID=2621516 RepID=UPI003C710E99